MTTAVTFTRVYPQCDGLEHQASPQRIKNVIASMNASQDSDWPFKVRVRMSDGSVVMISPRKRK